MKTILKLMLAMGVVMVSLLITAVSCDKEPAAGGGSGGNNSDNNAPGGRVGSLTVLPVVGASDYVKVLGNTVSINAYGLSRKLAPLSDANDANRSFNDIIRAHAISSNKYVLPFAVVYPRTSAAMVFVNRAHVTKDTISLRAYDDCSESSESGDNAFAKATGGGTCRYIYDDSVMVLNSVLGTVFNNTKPTKARGTMMCHSYLLRQNGSSKEYPTITDTLKFNRNDASVCYMGVVNNGLGSRVEIDINWVHDGGATKEVWLYAIGIDVSEKTISEFSSAPGFNRFEFAKPLDNAAFKKMLEKHQWRDLRFRVKIIFDYSNIF